jgi:nucleoside-diphosphate-sugar epimerase
MLQNVLVTGGAGYVGCVLVPKLLQHDYHVTVLDLYMFGDDVLDGVKENPNLRQIKDDMRDAAVVQDAVNNVDAVIHLASISNDPCSDLNPDLTKSVNLDAVQSLISAAKASGVQRFINASSSSVYGVREEPNVTEDMSLDPITLYARYKAETEQMLLDACDDQFSGISIRPATVCGYSPRLRLDLTVNILTNLAINNNEITVFGGEQKRPNLHIEDMTDLYCKLLELPAEQINRKVYNAGYENHKVKQLAEIVKGIIGDQVNIVTTPTEDNRSYHVSSEKIAKELGFVPQHTIDDAVRDLKNAFDAGKIPDSLTDIKYSNIKTMQAMQLK